MKWCSTKKERTHLLNWDGGPNPVPCFTVPCVHMCVCAQSCPTLCNPMDCSYPGFFLHGILQASTLELVAPPPGKLHDPWIEPASPALQADSLQLSHQGSPCRSLLTVNSNRSPALIFSFNYSCPSLPIMESWFSLTRVYHQILMDKDEKIKTYLATCY